jgi:DNA-binding NarL/FixJ family response regulator
LEAIARGVQDVLAGNYPISPSMAKSLFQIAGAPELKTQASQFALSARERDTLYHLSQGLSYAEAAVEMGVSLSTVQTHIRNLYRKLGVNSQLQAVMRAQQSGIL